MSKPPTRGGQKAASYRAETTTRVNKQRRATQAAVAKQRAATKGRVKVRRQGKAAAGKTKARSSRQGR